MYPLLVLNNNEYQFLKFVNLCCRLLSYDPKKLSPWCTGFMCGFTILHIMLLDVILCHQKNHVCLFLIRICQSCKKKRGVCVPSFLELFPKTNLETLVRMLYFWLAQEQPSRTAEHLGVTRHLVGRVNKDIRSVCSLDLVRRPFYPFGGPNCVCKCDESKFTHKSKVRYSA